MIFVHILFIIYEAGENEGEKNYVLLKIQENGIFFSTYEVGRNESVRNI